MNYIDVILILIIILNVAIGWRRGFIVGMLRLTGWIGSIILALILYPHAAIFLGQYMGGYELFVQPLAFLIVFLLSSLLLYQIAFFINKPIPVRYHHYTLNKILGIFPGLLNALVIMGIFIVLVLSLPISGSLKGSVQQSKIADRLACTFDRAEGLFAPVFEDAVKQTLNNLTISPRSDSFIELPFNVSDVKARPDLEAEMLQLLNNERAGEGLGLLSADSVLREVARSHSIDMFARGYFSHNTPDNDDPFDRIRAAGIRFITAGENIALAQTLNMAHNSLMNSPGHRANILRPNFGKVGIGIVDGGRYGLMVTQKFKN